ncbi:MAG: CAP domain-containing protein [Candidatus Saccharimonadales bacterium]|nr:CAP domain-containing protein [Candidatus Saccharimonadales bacterium]
MSFEKPTVGDWLTVAIMFVILSFSLNSYLDYRATSAQPAARTAQSVLNARTTNLPEPTRQEEKVIIDINETRRQNGLSPLELDFTLMQNAKSYAQELSLSCSQLEHGDLEPYLNSSIEGRPILKYGENLALHMSSLDGALEQLKDSPSHYATINGDYTHAGVAVLQSTPTQCHGTIFVVQHFARIAD